MATPLSRTIKIPRRAVTPNGFVPSVLPRRWPDKLTGEVIDIAVDFANVLEADETITAASVAITPSQVGGLADDDTDIQGTKAIVWLSLGRADQDYAAVVSINTSGGRTIQFPGQILVVDAE